MSNDDLDYAQIAADQEFAKAIAAGAELEYDNAAPVPDLPPPGAPVMVVRPVRLPFGADQAIQDLAKRRGVTASALIRQWLLADLEAEALVAQEDPAVVLRGIQASMQRVIDRLSASQYRDAA